MWNGMLQKDMKNKEIRIHPTQKPVALYKWLLKNYAKPGDKILDTHVGSASSLIACYDMGFDYIGFEIDEEYYNAAQKRIAENKAQVRMML
jgi:site-specific DNA-methyltransferase (adenine-specific)